MAEAQLEREHKLKRILVVSQNDLLHIGIERLLGQSNSYSIHQSFSLDEKEIILQIQQMGMDVIIIETPSENLEAESLLRLLSSSKQLRVLTLEINSNQIKIYDKREVLLQFSEDLISYL